MTADEKWETRWKGLKEYVEDDKRHCEEEIAKLRKQNKEGWKITFWEICRDADHTILDEMARLEKED